MVQSPKLWAASQARVFPGGALRRLLGVQLLSYSPKLHKAQCRSCTNNTAHHDDHLYVHSSGLLSHLCRAGAPGSYAEPEPPVRKIQQKLTFAVAILVS